MENWVCHFIWSKFVIGIASDEIFKLNLTCNAGGAIADLPRFRLDSSTAKSNLNETKQSDFRVLTVSIYQRCSACRRTERFVRSAPEWGLPLCDLLLGNETDRRGRIEGTASSLSWTMQNN